MDDILDRSVSEFNGAQLKLFRIDNIIKGFMDSRRSMDVEQMLFWLKDFDDELESNKSEDELESFANDLLMLSTAINNYIGRKNNPRIPKIIRDRIPIPAELINALNTFYKKLLRIYKLSGLEQKLQGTALSNFGRT